MMSAVSDRDLALKVCSRARDRDDALSLLGMFGLLGDSQPVPEMPPCEMRLTCPSNSNGKVLVVRCPCMAPTFWRYGRWPSARFTRYEPLGTAGSLDEARALFYRHCAEAGSVAA